MARQWKQWGLHAAIGFAAAGLLTFLGVETEVFGGNGGPRRSPPASSQASHPPPFVPPPQPGPEQWSMPGLWQRNPPFPYLPGEDRDRSRSIGGVVHGHLVNSVAIPQPHPALTFLEEQYERKLYYTTDRMRDIVVGAAEHVRKHFPSAVVQLGNFGNPGGGDIPYSFSHNSGRDADLGFFMKGPEGDPAIPPDLIPLNARGRYDGEKGTFVFDTARNWRLVEGLIEEGGQQLQYIFVSRPLKRRLLRRAREVDAPGDVRTRARRILHQPYGSLPHNDHFHLRIYCSRLDVASGCWDRGIEHPWYDDYDSAKAGAVTGARNALEADSADVRASGARRLALLDDQGSHPKLIERLEDESPTVRAAAARALAKLGLGEDEIGKKLTDEPNAQAYLEMVDALSRIGGDRSVETLTAELDSKRTERLPGEVRVDTRVFVAEALIRLEEERPVPTLVELLDTKSAELRVAVARALNYLTNHRFGDDWSTSEPAAWRDELSKWESWLKKYGDHRRESWLREGFKEAGFDVDTLDGDSVWNLCRAVTDADHLSYNAQRVLMQISGRQPESLSWSKEDANFFWRRWFERRRQRFGVPPVPEGMSTLD